ncbi:DUF1800 domain-containing protein [Paucibacter sp. DJ1R-11]|uniref:DUF1800 domain-containing protein n=1 Tax=Paucibacter sp. DJ1R-11 TaxID=2893556 RepID=UPI0021E3E7CF|nr:DUF1800 domain-containing protein [Paucibacter sp. DJ1R-11]MCV2363956.1 DUF1800 domain-containing protein [Paucibacter sp. DJ1R-11]
MSAEERAWHALSRLSYGPRSAELQDLQRLGPQAWLEQFLASQLRGSAGGQVLPDAVLTRLQGLETLGLSQAQLFDRYQEARRLARLQAAASAGSAPAAEQASRRELVRPILAQAAEQRLLRALHSSAQLEEQLLEFWFNHFNVFAGKGPVAALVGSYEREAVRPHLWGRFRQMLGATAKHPAMLFYLDNAQSVAPGFRPPARLADEQVARPRGLNENYARELMELHTLGVDGGYSQADVTELARMLTGWTVDVRGPQGRGTGELFEFAARRHDTGPKQWLGRPVTARGQAEGEWALDVLASHPATARHLSRKLAQAFVADEPPEALVAELSAKFLSSGGDLRAWVQTLLSSEHFWQREHLHSKFKTPYQYLLSTLRVLDAQPQDVQPLLGALAQAGMPLYGAATPDGYKNVASAWLNPEALSQRIQWLSRLNERTAGVDRSARRGPVLLRSLGPWLGEATRTVVAAEPAEMQLALLLGSPDFMRR